MMTTSHCTLWLVAHPMAELDPRDPSSLPSAPLCHAVARNKTPRAPPPPARPSPSPLPRPALTPSGAGTRPAGMADKHERRVERLLSLVVVIH